MSISREKRIRRINYLIASGIKTPAGLARNLGVSENTLYSTYYYQSDMHNVIPEKSRKPRENHCTKINEKFLDGLIKKGLTLDDCAERCHVTKEGVRQYILRKGKSDSYLEARMRISNHFTKTEQNDLSNVTSQQSEEEMKKAQEENPWAYAKTEEVFSKCPTLKENFLDIYRFIRDFNYVY